MLSNVLMLNNFNATAIKKKYYCGGKWSIGLNDGRRKKAVPRAAAGYARQLKILSKYACDHFV